MKQQRVFVLVASVSTLLGVLLVVRGARSGSMGEESASSQGAVAITTTTPGQPGLTPFDRSANAPGMTTISVEGIEYIVQQELVSPVNITSLKVTDATDGVTLLEGNSKVAGEVCTLLLSDSGAGMAGCGKPSEPSEGRIVSMGQDGVDSNFGIVGTAGKATRMTSASGVRTLRSGIRIAAFRVRRGETNVTLTRADGSSLRVPVPALG